MFLMFSIFVSIFQVFALIYLLDWLKEINLDHQETIKQYKRELKDRQKRINEQNHLLDQNKIELDRKRADQKRSNSHFNQQENINSKQDVFFRKIQSLITAEDLNFTLATLRKAEINADRNHYNSSTVIDFTHPFSQYQLIHGRFFIQDSNRFQYENILTEFTYILDAGGRSRPQALKYSNARDLDFIQASGWVLVETQNGIPHKIASSENHPILCKVKIECIPKQNKAFAPDYPNSGFYGNQNNRHNVDPYASPYASPVPTRPVYTTNDILPIHNKRMTPEGRQQWSDLLHDRIVSVVRTFNDQVDVLKLPNSGDQYVLLPHVGAQRHKVGSSAFKRDGNPTASKISKITQYATFKCESTRIHTITLDEIEALVNESGERGVIVCG